MSFEEKKILNSYFVSNLNNFTLVWMLSSASSLKKIKNLQKITQGIIIKIYHLCHECQKIKNASHWVINKKNPWNYERHS